MGPKDGNSRLVVPIQRSAGGAPVRPGRLQWSTEMNVVAQDLRSHCSDSVELDVQSGPTLSATGVSLRTSVFEPGMIVRRALGASRVLAEGFGRSLWVLAAAP